MVAIMMQSVGLSLTQNKSKRVKVEGTEGKQEREREREREGGKMSEKYQFYSKFFSIFLNEFSTENFYRYSDAVVLFITYT